MLVKADAGTEKYVAWAKKKADELGALARDLGLEAVHRSFDVGGGTRVFIVGRRRGEHSVRITGGSPLECLAVLGTLATGVHDFLGLKRDATGLYVPDTFTSTGDPKFPWPATASRAPLAGDFVSTHEDARYGATAKLNRTDLALLYFVRSVAPPHDAAVRPLASFEPRLSAERFVRDDGVDLRLQKLATTPAAGKEFPPVPLVAWRALADAAFPSGSGYSLLKEDVALSPRGTLALQRQYAMSNAAQTAGTYVSRYSIDADTVDVGASGLTLLSAATLDDFTLYLSGGGGSIFGTFTYRSQLGFDSRASLTVTPSTLAAITVGTGGPSTRAPTPYNAVSSPKVPGSSETSFGFGREWPAKVELAIDGASVATLHEDTIAGAKTYMFCPHVCSVTVEGDEYWFVNATAPKAALVSDGSGGFNNDFLTTYTYKRWVFKNGALLSSSSASRVYDGAVTDADPTLNPWSDTASVFVHVPTGGMRVKGTDWFCGFRVEQLFTPHSTMSTPSAPSKTMNYRIAPALFTADLSQSYAYAPLFADRSVASNFDQFTNIQPNFTDDVNAPIGSARLANYKGAAFLAFVDPTTGVAYGVAVADPTMAPVAVASPSPGVAAVRNWYPRTVLCRR